MKIAIFDATKAANWITGKGRTSIRKKRVQRKAINWLETGKMFGQVSPSERKQFIQDYSFEELVRVEEEFRKKQKVAVGVLLKERRRV